jgi:glycosyltransferase involved in cell wall biosynthesis
LKRPYNAVMASGDRVIAISDYVADVIRRRHHIDENRMTRIHRGVDMIAFDPAQVAENRIITLAQKWRLPDAAPVVLLPGRLTRWKGQILAIDAMAKLENKSAVLVLVGDHQGREKFLEELEEHIEIEGVNNRVRLVGDCRDMPAAYMLADVVLSASTEPEGFGRVSAEGLAMGRPVVATDHGGSMEIIVHNENGILVPNADAGAMAAAIDELLHLDPEERQLLANKARRYVDKNFSVARMCADTLAIYRELLEQPG